MRTGWNALLCVSGVALLLVATGCNPRFNVETTAKEGLESKSVEVHVVGVNPSELNQWGNYSVTDYWSPGDPMRESAVAQGYVYVMRFGPGLPNPQTLLKSDPIWRTWDKRDVKYMVLMAYLPQYTKQDDQPGDADPRRKILPREGSHWDWSYWGMDLIKVEVAPGGVTCLTPHKPVKVE